jgi:CHASE2 domain-containing sensor protein
MSEQMSRLTHQLVRFLFGAVPERVLQINSHLARALSLTFSLFAALLLCVLFWPSLSLFEERVGSLGWTLFPDAELEERIVIVAIDERSIASVGPWPWSREKMSQLVTSIDEAGAQLQIHDIVYSEPKSGDEALRAAFAASSGVVISQIPVLSENSVDPEIMQDIQSGTMTHSLSGISCSGQVGTGLDLPSTNSYIGSNAVFADTVKGHIAPLINSDGSISKQPAIVCVDGLPYPALAISALHQVSSASTQNKPELPAKIDDNNGLFGPAQKLTLNAYPGLVIPLDNSGNLRVSYASHPSSYQAISAVDVLNRSADLSLLKNSWALVGATAFGLDDVVPTPFSGSAPGVELQARILQSILDVNVPYSPRVANWLIGVMCACFAAILLRVSALNGRFVGVVLPMLVVFFPVISLAIHAQLLHSFSMWLGWLFPALFGAISAAIALLYEQAKVRNQRNRVLGNLESYLPKGVAQQIAYSLPSSDIEASRRNVTLLSADLRNFSAHTESRPAEESAAVLHFFFQTATQIIEKCGGRIQEFNGDSLLAVWDEQSAESAESAYRAGLQMLEQINCQLLEKYVLEGLEALAVGIGIEQGPALIGSIGPAHRRAHALLGETVTIALRVQEMTVDLAQPILLGEVAARQLQSVNLQSQGSYLLAGLKNPHTLYAPAPERSHFRDDRNAPKLKVLSGGRR